MSPLIAVYTCRLPRCEARIKTQLDTWIPALRAEGYQVELFDGPRLKTPDGYNELTAKTWALIKWAYDHGHSSLMKIDDDSVVNPNTFKPVEFDYAGIRAKANSIGYPEGTFPYEYCSGGVYWLSRRAMEILLNVKPLLNFGEDRLVGNTLAANGIELTELKGYSLYRPIEIDWIVVTQSYPKAMEELYAGIKA